MNSGSNRSLDNGMDWANPDNYGKWTGSQASIITTDDHDVDDHNMDDYHEDEMKNELVPKDQQIPSLKTIFGKNKDKSKENNRSQDNIRKEESDSDDSLMREQDNYVSNPNITYDMGNNSGLYQE